MKLLLAFTFIVLFGNSMKSMAYDWPMWRFDHHRSASTPEQLADRLYLQWQIQFSPRVPVWDDPLNQNLMQFDRLFEPIVVGDKLYLGFNDQDKVVAYDLNTGKELWHYYTDGPVRMPLAANKGKIYLTSDDGWCYCLNGSSGALLWKKMLAPATGKLLGNKRLISMWPARGGIVIKDDILYTAASIFPMMGTFVYAIHAETGEIVWKNEGTGSNYILQPHKSPAFADVAPQGSFTISGNYLLVAGGRSVPAAFELKTGEERYYHLAASGKTGGSFTCANDKVFFNHHRERMTTMYNSETGVKLQAEAGEYPVIDGARVYFSGKKIGASLLDESNQLNPLWHTDYSARNDLIRAGNTLYAADSTGITAIKIAGDQPQKLWTVATAKPAERLIASNGKLIAVTADGTILVYGNSAVRKVVAIKNRPAPLKAKSSVAEEILASAQVTSGYAVVYGTEDPELLKALISKTSLNIVAFGKDEVQLESIRTDFDKLGIGSERISFLRLEADYKTIPKYFSSLTIFPDPSWIQALDAEAWGSIFESIRPYGGKLWIRTGEKEQKEFVQSMDELDLYGAVLTKGDRNTVVTRSGSLEGSASWTHSYGDIANTVKSNDEIVRAPLGILWFGGNSNLDVLPRHGHGPSEQVIDGRLIIQGVNSISARDVYTGRMLWKKVFEGVKEDTWLIFYDETYDEENPLDPKYNQIHLPGANARGTNFIATKEYVYVIEGNKCHLIDIVTGKLVKTFTTGDKDTQKIAYIGVYNNYLILGNDFSAYPKIDLPDKPDAREADKERDSKKFENFDITASRELLIMDRFTGKKRWSIKANHGFIHNSVIAGDELLFCLDKLPQNLETKLKRRGEEIPVGSRLLYLDIHTGKIIREETTNVFGTWLGYSAEKKLLLQATRPSRDMLNGEEGKRMIVYNAETKKVLWDKAIKYLNPPIISGDKIYTNGEGFSLLTGEPLVEKDPVTGEELKWSFKREYGCGYVVASEHLLTFRSASAGFINLDVFEGTGSLGGFKAGCSANLIVADGVLNSPDYTRTCQCAYQNQTSLAFVSMPWMNYWTNSNYSWSGNQIKKLGLNLNAPGDRVSANDVLWLEYPNAGGPAPGITVKMDTVGYFKIRKDPVSIKAGSAPWICSSAIGGIRTMEITLSKEKAVSASNYQVNLYFSELENKMPGERIFDIKLQDKKVLENFDVVKESGAADRELVKSFSGIKAGNVLKIDLSPVKGNTILSGIEVIMEI